MRWKITTLIENHGDEEGKLTCEHGLSLLIEGQGFRMLMDTGQTGAFYDNAKKMGIPLADLDCVLLSHAHYDHADGFLRLIREEGIPRKLYVGQGFFRKAYHEKNDGRMKYIGCKFDHQMLKDLGVPIREIDEDVLEISEGVVLHRNFDQVTDYEMLNPHFFYQEENPSCGPFGRCMDSLNYKPDSFKDETVLTLETKKGLFVIAACSHPGIMNILSAVAARTGKPVCGFIGGTHLVDADESRVRKTAESFKKLGVDFVAASHCTGDRNIEIFQECFGDSFVFNCTGNTIVL